MNYQTNSSNNENCSQNMVGRKGCVPISVLKVGFLTYIRCYYKLLLYHDENLLQIRNNSLVSNTRINDMYESFFIEACNCERNTI